MRNRIDRLRRLFGDGDGDSQKRRFMLFSQLIAKSNRVASRTTCETMTEREEEFIFSYLKSNPNAGPAPEKDSI